MKKNMKSLKGKYVVSLDITDVCIHVIYGKRLSDAIKVKKAFDISLPKGSFEDGVILDYDTVVIALKDGLKINKIRNNRYGMCTFDIKDIISRVMVLPVVKSEHLINMINIEMQQHIPIDLTNFVVQYKIQNTFKRENVEYYEILVVAAPRDIVSDMYRLMKEAGLRPAVMDWQPNSANKLFINKKINDSEILDKNTITLVNIHKSFTSFTIISKGKNKYNRIFTVGNKELYFSLNKNSVHELVDIGDVNNDFMNTLDTQLDETSIEAWLDELERIMKFYSSREVGNKIDSIYIYGDLSGIGDLPHKVEEYLSVPTSFIDEISKIYLHKLINRFNKNQYINALGTIINNYKPDKLSDINFLESFLKSDKNVSVSSMLSILLILLSIGYVGFDYYDTSVEISVFEDRIEALDLQIESEKIKENLKIIEERHKEYDLLLEFNENVILIDNYIDGQSIFNKVYYYTMIHCIPDKVFVSSINVNSNSISFSATADSELAIAELEKRLRDTGLFDGLNIPSISYNEENDIYSFGISFSVRSVE